MPKQLERKFISLAGFKALNDGNGGFEGYGNDIGVLDSYDDITVGGCFEDGLAEFVESGWSAPDHEWGIREEIGLIVEAREDDRGLFTRVEFHPTDDAQNVRQKIQHRLEKGKTVNLSIGYVALKWRYVSGNEAIQYLKEQTPDVVARLKATPRVRLLLKVKVYEVSVVSVGANPNSGVTAVKGMKGMSGKSVTPEGFSIKGLFEKLLQDRTNSPYNLFDVLCYAIWQIEYLASCATEAGTDFDAGALFDEALAEFSARLRASVLKEIGEGDGSIYDYLGVTATDTNSDTKSISQNDQTATERPPAGRPFAAHSETVLAAVKGLAERAHSIHGLRAKEGRTLSAANRERMSGARDQISECITSMQAVHDDMGELLDATEPPTKVAELSRVRSLKTRFLKYEASLRGVLTGSGEN
jgi:HK97 family phage prohead protease